MLALLGDGNIFVMDVGLYPILRRPILGIVCEYAMLDIATLFSMMPNIGPEIDAAHSAFDTTLYSGAMFPDWHFTVISVGATPVRS